MRLFKEGGIFSITLLLALSLIVAACGGDGDAVPTTAVSQENATTADGGDNDVAAIGTTAPEPQNAPPMVG